MPRLALRADHPRALRLQAEALFHLGRFEEVVAAFDRYLETGKPLESVYRGRGLARAELGQISGRHRGFHEGPGDGPHLGRASVPRLDASGRSMHPSWPCATLSWPSNSIPAMVTPTAAGVCSRQPGSLSRGDPGCRGGHPPRTAVTAVALQRRTDLRPVPRPQPAACIGVDPAGLRLLPRDQQRAFWSKNIRKRPGPGRAASTSGLHPLETSLLRRN